MFGTDSYLVPLLCQYLPISVSSILLLYYFSFFYSSILLCYIILCQYIGPPLVFFAPASNYYNTSVKPFIYFLVLGMQHFLRPLELQDFLG